MLSRSQPRCVNPSYYRSGSLPWSRSHLTRSPNFDRCGQASLLPDQTLSATQPPFVRAALCSGQTSIATHSFLARTKPSYLGSDQSHCASHTPSVRASSCSGQTKVAAHPFLARTSLPLGQQKRAVQQSLAGGKLPLSHRASVTQIGCAGGFFLRSNIPPYTHLQCGRRIDRSSPPLLVWNPRLTRGLER